MKWARQPRTLVSTVDELDAALDQAVAAAAGDYPHLVSIYPAEHDGDWPPTLQIGIGHPHRSAAHWISAVGAGTGYQPDIQPWRAPISFDLGGVATDLPPEDTLVTPDAAREAAREYVRTGRRPAGLAWRAA